MLIKRVDSFFVKTPPPDLFMHEARHAARLADEVALIAAEHATQHRLSRVSVIGSLSWVLGRMLGALARDGRGDLEEYLTFLSRQVRRAAVSEMSRRSFTLQ